FGSQGRGQSDVIGLSQKVIQLERRENLRYVIGFRFFRMLTDRDHAHAQSCSREFTRARASPPHKFLRPDMFLLEPHRSWNGFRQSKDLRDDMFSNDRSV